MAIMSPGPLAGAISGDVGGVCFSNPTGSKVIRKKRSSSPFRIPFEEKSLSPMTVFASLWSQQIPSAKKAWDTVASQRLVPNRLGINRNLSGYQLFVQWNSHQSGITTSNNLLPPNGVIRQEMSNLAVTSSVASGIEFTFDDSLSPDFRIFTIYLGNPMRSTVPKFQRDWRKIASTFTATTAYDLTANWSNIWPLPVLGQVIAVRVFVNVPRENFRGNPQDFFAITTA